MGNIPAIIKEVGFDFPWDEKKVWALELPIEEIPANDLAWHFEVPFLNTDSGFYDLRPCEVMQHPEKYAKEYQRTMKADLSYPIEIMRNKGRWLILDGLHRLMKAHLQDMKTVRIRKVDRKYIPLIRP